MIVRAPGKLFTTGAYAVLEGAPAIVLAVNRYVTARPGPASTRPEVVEVARRLGGAPPSVDVSALESGGRKLGLGSSAAAVVASAAVLLGIEDLRNASTRRRIFDEALAAHAAIQPRGSGADVAAATFGGVIRVQKDGSKLDVQPAELPAGLVVRAFALERSARTSDALDRLAAYRDGASRALAMLVEAANEGARAATATAFVEAATHHVEGLAALGASLDLPLVPPEVSRAREVLFSATEMRFSGDFTLLPSGAGGGDTVLWLGARAPTEQEAATLDGLGLHLLDLDLDSLGVHVVERS
jgi:phosphomevalonate kinase